MYVYLSWGNIKQIRKDPCSNIGLVTRTKERLEQKEKESNCQKNTDSVLNPKNS